MPEAVVGPLVQPRVEQVKSRIEAARSDGVPVELDRGCQVGHGLDPLRRRACLEVFPQAAVYADLVGQPVVGVLSHDRVQVVALAVRVAQQQPARLELVQGHVQLGALPGGHGLERLVVHRAAKGGDAAEQLAALGGHLVVGDREDVMPLLALQLVQHRVPPRRLDVALHPAVLDDRPRQQAHRQRMPAVGLDRLGDLGPRAFHSRGLEEAHHVVGRKIFEPLVTAAGEVGQLVREQARCEQHSPGKRE